MTGDSLFLKRTFVHLLWSIFLLGVGILPALLIMDSNAIWEWVQEAQARIAFLRFITSIPLVLFGIFTVKFYDRMRNDNLDPKMTREFMLLIMMIITLVYILGFIVSLVTGSFIQGMLWAGSRLVMAGTWAVTIFGIMFVFEIIGEIAFQIGMYNRK